MLNRYWKDAATVGAIGLVIAAFVVLLSACAKPDTVVRDRFTPVSVPVIQPCASEKPKPVVPLNERFTSEEWQSLSPKQHMDYIAIAALQRLNHGDELAAATSAC